MGSLSLLPQEFPTASARDTNGLTITTCAPAGNRAFPEESVGFSPRDRNRSGSLRSMAIVLYEIFWSHYCEKARFCLDFKRLTYRIVAVNPFTRRQAVRLGTHGDVPILVDGGRVIAGSNAIAAHLEETYPDPPLLPSDAGRRAEVLALESECDQGLGPDARRVAYDVALQNRDLL